MEHSIDREKVIKALENCVLSDDCRACEYWMRFDDTGCQIMKDALALLKLQQLDIEALKNTIQGMVEGQCIIAGDKRVEVVRCGDCVNCVKEPNGELYCDILAVGYEPLGSKKVHEDWFCADGKRK